MWTIYDYWEPPRKPISEWLQAQQRAQQAKLAYKLRSIENDHDNERGRSVPFPPPWVDGSLGGKYRTLYEIKIQGGPSGANIRVLVCRGPRNNDNEITLLFGARELDDEWEPKNAPEIALERYERISADIRFRCPHDWL
jgi:hypothetical protein